LGAFVRFGVATVAGSQDHDALCRRIILLIVLIFAVVRLFHPKPSFLDSKS
jgi:hypothetical protein